MQHDTADTLVALLRSRAAATPARTALEFAGDDGTEHTVDYAGLDRRARAIAAALAERAGPGDRALLVYPPGLDYVAGFFGCLYAGVVAVPVYPPTGRRGLERLSAVIGDAGATAALADATGLALAGALLDSHPSLSRLATDELPDAGADDWSRPPPAPADLAFLQYTSGSTGTPKGVMVRHGNLIANARTIAGALGLGEDDHGVSWLPPYHDMGLIGGILQPIHGGFPCTLLSPLTFLRSPYRWLETVSRKRATISAAPDFAYRECVRRIGEEERAGLDLSGWRHALVGAEPVRADTLDRFASAFGGAGFRRTAFYPCYGLAEATLFVTGGAVPGAGPRLAEVDRGELQSGRAVVAAAGGDRPTTVMTGCGSGRGEDLVLVVDTATGRPCPPGEVGEVWVGGPTVAAGYWGRPEETGRTFGARLPGHDRAFLRTGDLGFDLDGELYITGRAKDLMVVRGRNHHPEDVERTAGGAHALLRPGRAAAFSVDDGTEERVVLAHEVTKEFRNGDATAVIRAVRAAVNGEHGLWPHDVVLLPSGGIPRTTSGKVRRRECRERWLAGSLKALAHDGPPGGGPGDGQATMEIIATALDLPPAGLDAGAPLVALGLDSLRAFRLAAEVEKATGVPVPVDRLLGGMTPDELRRHVLAADAPAPAAGTGPAEDTPADGDAGTPRFVRASAAQERMWLLDRLGADGANHIAAGLRIRGPLDLTAFRAALDALLDRHDVLRSVFRVEEDDVLYVAAGPRTEAELPVVDAGEGGEAEAGRVIEELAARPFDLVAGPPVRMVLVRTGPDAWCFGIAAHHIVVDGWSLGLLAQRIGRYYTALVAGRPLPERPAEAPVPPAGAVPAGPDAAATEAFWRERLAGAQALELPADRPRPQLRSWAGTSLPVEIPAGQARRLRGLAASRRATPFMAVLTALSVVLARWSGQDDLVIGAAVAGRRGAGMADLVGLFVDTLPLRVDVSGEPGFAELLERVRDTCLAAYPHQDLPVERILRTAGDDTSDGRAPLLRVLLALQNVPLDPWEAGGVRAEPFELPAPGAQFELSLHLSERPDGSLTGHAVHAADLFETDMVRDLLDGLPLVIEAALATPDRRVRDLPLLPRTRERRVVGEFSGAGTASPAPALVHELVEARADAAPDRVAVSGAEGSLTYGELETRANRLAWYLRERGCGPDEPVAVCLPRSPLLVVALLAVLKAGGAYLPLEPSYPPERLAGQLADASPRLLLTVGATAEGLTRPSLPADLTVVLLDEEPGPADHCPASRPPAVASPLNLVNVIYTSGSTGRPKGVMTAHAALSVRLAWMQDAYALGPGEVVLHKTPVGFDVAGWELFWPLIAGATLHVARPGGHHDPAYLARTIQEQAVTTCHFVPSMLGVFLDEPSAPGCARTLRRVICSGEELPPSVVERFGASLPGVELHNLYGPTEAAIDVSAHAVPAGGTYRGRVPIGRPIAGARLYILDAYGRPVPPRVAGELHIGGSLVARGYLGRAALTAERFVPDPFVPGARLYRTGDRARWLADGTIEFLGRVDHQIKIRGTRIEPGEIEAALNAHPAVGASAVALRSGADGESRLVAYVVPARGKDSPESTALRAFLARTLPPAMIPTTFAEVDRLPLSANGKLDRSALPEPGPSMVRKVPPTPPRTPVERRIAGIWTDVLRLGEVSVTDDFFDLGGDSLLATRIVARIDGAFGVRLPVEEMFAEGLTVERLARVVLDRQAEQADPEELVSMLDWMRDLTDEQVAELLAREQRDGKRLQSDL